MQRRQEQVKKAHKPRRLSHPRRVPRHHLPGPSAYDRLSEILGERRDDHWVFLDFHAEIGSEMILVEVP